MYGMAVIKVDYKRHIFANSQILEVKYCKFYVRIYLPQRSFPHGEEDSLKINKCKHL